MPAVANSEWNWMFDCLEQPNIKTQNNQNHVGKDSKIKKNKLPSLQATLDLNTKNILIYCSFYPQVLPDDSLLAGGNKSVKSYQGYISYIPKTSPNDWLAPLLELLVRLTRKSQNKKYKQVTLNTLN